MRHDLPLMAEYILLEPTYSRARLEQHILDETLAAGVDATDSHRSLARLGADQVWTTNYDPLIERADPTALVISSDDDVRLIGTARMTIIKMHGSIPNGPEAKWADPPVITRSDFETYEDQHRRLWALLRSSYLSKTLLFLGFSFADANIEIFQRLARRHGTAARDRHIAVLKTPHGSDVRVHEIAEYMPRLDGIGVRSTRSVGRARRLCTQPILVQPDRRRPPTRPVSEHLGDLVLGGGSGLALVSETLGKLATVALVLLFELGEVAHADATVAADAMGRDLAAVEQLGQMRAAHAEALGGLTRRDRRIAIDDDDFVAGTNATAQAQQ